MQKRDEMLIENMVDEISAGIRDSATNKTEIQAKTLLTKQRIKQLDLERLSLKSPWVEDPEKWFGILRIWEKYRSNLKKIDGGKESLPEKSSGKSSGKSSSFF